MIPTPSPLKHYKTVKEYIEFASRFNGLGDEIEKAAFNRLLCRTDLFWLLWFACGRKDIAHQWLLDRCKEVEAEPNECLDLWPRDHRKSTIITFGKTIQDILASHGENPLPEWDREVTVGIFSVTNKVAKPFIKQIKYELEKNQILKGLFPDILYDKPNTQSPRWSDQDGIVVKRKGNPKEATVEAYGLIDGQPTGRHFLLRVYDDIIDKETVNTPEMIQKALESWQMSANLGTTGGIKRHIGTRYHANDPYNHILTEGLAKSRIYKATKNGRLDGEPVLLSHEEWEIKKREMGVYIVNCQMMQDPIADSIANFKTEWLRQFGSFQKGDKVANIYITIDPANSKKKTSDYTVMMVIACCADRNYYLIDCVRDRLSLSERTEQLFRLHRKWRPNAVGYERYGMQSDIDHIKGKMDEVNYHFNIIELAGKLSKEDRIRKLQPVFEQGCFWMPYSIDYMNYEGKRQNLIDIFIKEEYLSFPISSHDDMLDAMARILDEELGVFFPSQDELEYERADYEYNRFAHDSSRNSVTGY